MADPTPSKREGFHSFSASGSQFVVDDFYAPRMVLGQGAYGVVISAIDTRTNKKVAIKKVSAAFKDVVDAKRILREMKLLRHFRHENVSQLVDVVDPPSAAEFNDVLLVLDYLETDLHKIIYSKNQLSDEHIQFFVYQILAGLRHIHSANVLHRDLKPANLLLNSDCELKICDFGLARGVSEAAGGGKEEEEDDDELTEYVVTRWYRAPEVMVSTNEYGTGVDLWAVGCILGELLGREPLFPGDDYIQQLTLLLESLGTPAEDEMRFITNQNAAKFIRGLPRYEKRPWAARFPDANPLALDLLDRLLRFDPAKRISVDEALAHPYLRELVEDLDAHKVACDEQFDFSFERQPLTVESIKEMMLDELKHFRPNAQVFKPQPPAPIAGGGVFNSV